MSSGKDDVKLPKAITDLLGQVLQWIVDNPQASPNFQQNAALGDMEFSQAVAPYLDPKDRKLIDPKIAKLARPEGSVQGMNTRQSDVPAKIGPREYAPGQVYAFGAANAHPALWAHEFRHDAPRHLAEPFGTAEALNRLEDQFHATDSFSQQWADQGVNDLSRAGVSPESLAILIDMLLNAHDISSRN